MSLIRFNGVINITNKCLLHLFVFMNLIGPAMTVAHAGVVGQAHQIAAAMGGSTQAPWESGLSKFQNSLTGPTAKAMGAILICLTGLGIGFGVGGDMLQKGMKVLLGLSVAFGGASWIGDAVGMGSGALL